MLPGLDSQTCVICGLSLLVLCSAPGGFSPGTPIFPSPEKPTYEFDMSLFVDFSLQCPQLDLSAQDTK